MENNLKCSQNCVYIWSQFPKTKKFFLEEIIIFFFFQRYESSRIYTAFYKNKIIHLIYIDFHCHFGFVYIYIFVY